MKVLVIDDDDSVRLVLSHFFRQRGYEVVQAASGGEGLTKAKEQLPDLVFLDQRLPDVQGEELLPYLVAPEISSWVIMMTAYVELDKAVQAMKQGAEYFLPKPLDLDQLGLLLERLEDQVTSRTETSRYRKLLDHRRGESDIIGESSHIIRLQRLISLLAKNSSTPVLILGESGSGKELVTRAIHRQSGVTGPLVEINCASLSENLLESELFGHEKGAFTDARTTKNGLFEVASEGTIFFDELGEMPLSIQAKLLKVLDTGKFRRVGGLADITSNARFIGATNRDLTKMVRNGSFREDLYYRINVLPVMIPPLRERIGDVPILAGYFCRILGENMGKGRARVTPSAMAQLQAYSWPGNVRELKNVIERALIVAGGRDILPQHLPLELRSSENPPSSDADVKFVSLAQMEEDYIQRVLAATNHNHSRTARILGISRSTLLAKLSRKKAAARFQDMS